jgi:photosystem II stability/assembly factor-like uncharacterized protein
MGKDVMGVVAALGVATLLLWQPAQAAVPEAQASYSIPSAKAARSLLLDIVTAGPRLVVVGDRGHVLYSDDQGASWVQAQVPTRQMLTAVYFVDAKHGWAVGHDAQVLASDDGGATWRKQYEDLAREAPLLGVWFKDAATGFAVGAYGALLATSDGGEHWQDVSDRLNNEDQLHLNAIAAVKDAGLFIVGEQGSMFRSADWGQSWERVEGPYEGSLFGVVGTAQANTLLAFGLRGNLWRSTDFGDSWHNIALEGSRGPLEFGLAGASLLADGTLALVGNGGTVLRSVDDGQTFSVFNRPDRIALASVAGTADGRLILAGQGGVRISSSKGAQEAAQ